MSEPGTKSDLAAAVAAINHTLMLRLGVMMTVGSGLLATLMKIL